MQLQTEPYQLQTEPFNQPTGLKQIEPPESPKIGQIKNDLPSESWSMEAISCCFIPSVWISSTESFSLISTFFVDFSVDFADFSSIFNF